MTKKSDEPPWAEGNKYGHVLLGIGTHSATTVRFESGVFSLCTWRRAYSHNGYYWEFVSGVRLSPDQLDKLNSIAGEGAKTPNRAERVEQVGKIIESILGSGVTFFLYKEALVEDHFLSISVERATMAELKSLGEAFKTDSIHVTGVKGPTTGNASIKLYKVTWPWEVWALKPRQDLENSSNTEEG